MPESALNAHSRIIYINSPQQNAKFASNVISTCKYNILSFLPRFLLEQFRRYNNVFFLVIVLLQQIPNVSPTGRYTTALPFVIILVVSALKEIFEDIKRSRSDKKVNNFKTRVLQNGKWEPRLWKKVSVGDVLRIENNELFPADLLLLSSSEPNAMSYIETSNLDGETNLKIRQGLDCTAELITLEKISAFSCEVECEPPSKHVNEFTGTLHMADIHRPIGINQILLRGAHLKNTRWIYGIVLYTGHDAKLLMNSKTAPLKQSNVDVMTNRRILILFATLVILAVVSAVGAQYFEELLLSDAIYLGFSGSATNFLYSVLTFFILYNNLIPISLQVTLEMVRFFQASFINNDLEMYDEISDTAAVARTSNLNEELGQVKFVMSDKTGTLTRNVMKFKRCSVAGKNYGNDETDEFEDPSFLNDITNSHSNKAYLMEFLRMMAVCHTVVPEKSEDGSLIYQASSPDEGALVRGAAALRFVFHTRKPQSVVINALGVDETYHVLNVLEFTSDRKRMSVVVRCPDGTIKLYVKGADSMIYDRLDSKALFRDECIAHLTDYATKGYRTLCFATRTIEKQYYEEWAKVYYAASISMSSREKKLADCAEMIENKLSLLGASAIEDKLQKGVPQTIRSLMDAEIRVWMLTGDKRETAVNIGHASGLCTPRTYQLLLNTRSYDETRFKLTSLIDSAIALMNSKTEFTLIIDGAVVLFTLTQEMKTYKDSVFFGNSTLAKQLCLRFKHEAETFLKSLHYALTGECRSLFLKLSLFCRSVICCRMTPMQKAEVVEMARGNDENVVLAIGDGANDVAMIQAANVGVGISGEEGLQAASASDYSIAQFRFLHRLLFVHGAWNFERSVKVILYSFYKNICLYLIELWFAFFSAFSGQTVFERWTIGLFNVGFTAFPPIMLGLFDKPVSEKTMLLFPALYFSLQERAFSFRRFAKWIGLAVLHSILLYFLSYAFLVNAVAWNHGRTAGWLMLGNSCYTFVVITVCLKALLECDSWTWILVIFSIGSIFLWLLFLVIYAAVWPVLPLGADMRGLAFMMLSSKSFWLASILIPIVALSVDYFWKVLQFNYAPSPCDLANWREKSLAADHEKLSRSVGNDEPYERNGMSGVANEAAVYGSIMELSAVAPETVSQAQSPMPSATTVVTHDDSSQIRTSYLGPLFENARLLENADSRQGEDLLSSGDMMSGNNEHGYAFSQEELGVVSQGDFVRQCNSTRIKPTGM